MNIKIKEVNILNIMSSLSLEDSVREWVRMDNEIKERYEELKKMREKRNVVMSCLSEHLERKNMKHAMIEINNGFLKLHKVKVQTPLTYRFIQQVLESYIEENGSLDIKQIMDYIKENREFKYIEDIKRTYKNK